MWWSKEGRWEKTLEWYMWFVFFFFKQKTAYEIVSRDWSSDVCSSDLCIAIYHSACVHRWSRLLSLVISPNVITCELLRWRILAGSPSACFEECSRSNLPSNQRLLITLFAKTGLHNITLATSVWPIEHFSGLGLIRLAISPYAWVVEQCCMACMWLTVQLFPYSLSI